MNVIARSIYEAAAMFWEVLWALVLGFSISAILQVFVSKERMTREFGQTSLRSVALATLFGGASSSCSYAAVAAAKTAFKKGAGLVPSLAFMFASTNIVIELGVVLWLLMGWSFVLAEFVGAFVLIAVMWGIVRLTLPKSLEDEARKHEETGGEHDHTHMSGARSKLQQIADAFVMDWSMIWRDMLIGFLIAGFLAVLVPNHVWKALFLSSATHPTLRLVENCIVGPIIAILSFVCSIGNVPLASILWSGGISFGGVISFIYADLIVIPLIIIYARYYGPRTALYITGVMFVSMVVSGFVVDGLFSALHLVPTGPRLPSAISHARFEWNYTTWLDIVALIVAMVFATVHKNRKSGTNLRSDHGAEERPNDVEQVSQENKHDHGHEGHAH